MLLLMVHEQVRDSSLLLILQAIPLLWIDLLDLDIITICFNLQEYIVSIQKARLKPP
jgi:hypothetical protein